MRSATVVLRPRAMPQNVTRYFNSGKASPSVGKWRRLAPPGYAAQVRCLMVALLTACAGTPPAASLFGPPRDKLAAEDYPRVLGAWTRSDKVYQGLESKMFVTTTFHA